MESVLLVMTNMPDAASANRLARSLVDARLAACVNCLPGVRSVYRWQGAIEEAEETTLLIKTVLHQYAALELAIRQAHPYQVPEIIAITPCAGWQPYLAWIAEETRKNTDV
ncbi:divalent-cation tolerance protein CutA [Janthinobacterium sp. 17J80-10]|uniref:divalent-cation tolerance protein CutA n=1 Tax=Janthinobacterium sp. 17J80-10 TaxID=2497863 RepID=UPI0010054F98|nr:divalent-cation tolerance protein CutA [Janthinobacterium sp. 17J80-10]QAU35873.1 divalent-cation tolerance protein CutA [Janthinobacterium sp. 17J80-10]